MSDKLLDARGSFAARADHAAMILARRKVVERARAHLSPKPCPPANDRDLKSA